MSKISDNKQQSAQEIVDNRRSFLKGAAVTTVAASSGALAANAVAGQEAKADPVTQKGYQETDHVRDYYRLARF